jgi:hypothetical protein
VEPALAARYDPVSEAITAREFRAGAKSGLRRSPRFRSVDIFVEQPGVQALMTHNSRTNPYFLAARTALVSATFAAGIFAQPLVQDGAAPGTPVAPPALIPAPAAQEPAKFVRYQRINANGAQARNLGDINGVPIGGLAPGSLVAIYKDLGDWLECEVPGGFEIWVFGEYVKASSEAGMLELTGSEVRARPLPSSGSESYPLQPNLSKGDRVRLITRKDSSKPLALDWVKVYSPPGVRGFVAKADCEALAPGMDGAKAWSQAVTESRKRKSAADTLIKTSLPAEAAAATGQAALSPQEAVAELQRADAALARERRAANPDFGSVRTLYQNVLGSGNEGATADMARRGLSEVDALIELNAIEKTILAERERAEAAAETRRKEMELAGQDPDAFKGRFDVRGWMEKRVVPGQPPTYFVRWGGDAVSEIQCNSGRYDLDAFVGCELGVKGRELRDYVPGEIGRMAVPSLVDAARIEVLACRATR